MKLKFVLVALLLDVVLTVAAFAAGHYTVSSPEPLRLDGLFEGQGAVTMGCSLWTPLVTRPAGPLERTTDFGVAGDSSELLLVAFIGDEAHLVSGSRCGISVDWTLIPLEVPNGD